MIKISFNKLLKETIYYTIIVDWIKTSYLARILTASEARKLINTFVNQHIFDTQYIRNLGEEAKNWL